MTYGDTPYYGLKRQAIRSRAHGMTCWPYGGGFAVEHEDPEWGGTLEKTLHGLQIAAHTLQPLLTT